MSTSVPTGFTQKFHGDFMLLAQQKDSRLMRTVRSEPDDMDANYAYYDRIGATEAVEDNTRHGDTPLVNTPHSRRRIGMSRWHWADLIDQKDWNRIRNAGVLPLKYRANAVASINRRKDRIITAAGVGNAVSIDEDLAATNVALTAAQHIAVNGEGMTLDKLINAKEILDAAEVDEEYKRYCVLTAGQVGDLLRTTEVKSSDYNTVKALVAGEINTFLGFEFIRTQLLGTDANGDRQCRCFTEMAIGVAMAEELTVDIGPRRDKKNSIQVYVATDLGATRIEEEQFVEIACAE